MWGFHAYRRMDSESGGLFRTLRLLQGLLATTDKPAAGLETRLAGAGHDTGYSRPSKPKSSREAWRRTQKKRPFKAPEDRRFGGQRRRDPLGSRTAQKKSPSGVQETAGLEDSGASGSGEAEEGVSRREAGVLRKEWVWRTLCGSWTGTQAWRSPRRRG